MTDRQTAVVLLLLTLRFWGYSALPCSMWLADVVTPTFILGTFPPRYNEDNQVPKGFIAPLLLVHLLARSLRLLKVLFGLLVQFLRNCLDDFLVHFPCPLCYPLSCSCPLSCAIACSAFLIRFLADFSFPLSCSAELIAINNKPAALELLHSVFTTRQAHYSCKTAVPVR